MGKQVVAGLKYTIQIEMGTSECFKTVESSSLDECPVAGDTAVTELVVIDQAWMAPDIPFSAVHSYLTLSRASATQSLSEELQGSHLMTKLCWLPSKLVFLN